jgi:predicted Zn-dependent protease
MIASALLGVSAIYVSMQANAEDKALQEAQAIEQAEASLAAAKSTGGIWQLIDKSTGSSSQSIEKLLAAAKQKQAAGEFDEAVRIANRVNDAAKLGVEQVESQKGKVAPYFN